MIEVYLVRHGESNSNASGVRQGSVGGLSKEGRKQAKFIAKRLKGIRFDLMVSSPWQRAKETAEIISKKVSEKVNYSKFFVERKLPSETTGSHWLSSKNRKVIKEIKKNAHKPNWHYSDEENFYDQKKRALKALDFLKKTGKKKILVITHGAFLRILIGCVILGKDVTAKDLLEFSDSLMVLNTGLTVLIHTDEAGKVMRKGWRLKVWNDHAHLG